MSALPPKADISQLCVSRLNNWSQRRHLLSDASEYDNCRPPLRSKGHVAFVYKADCASRIERVGIENLLVLIAARAAGCLITGRSDEPDRRSAGSGAGRAIGARR